MRKWGERGLVDFGKHDEQRVLAGDEADAVLEFEQECN